MVSASNRQRRVHGREGAASDGDSAADGWLRPPAVAGQQSKASTNYREAFQLFDKRGNGRVDRGSLGDLLRACGQNPTLAEIADLERGVGADFDFDTFSKILNRPGGFREPFDIEEYIRGFQVFDKDRSGFVGKGQIKYILTNLGEKMSEEEVDELFKSTIDASNDEVDYREFVKTIAEN